VFAEATGGLGEIGRSVDEPNVLLKLFGSEEAMRSALPPRCQVRSAGYFMTLSGELGARAALPMGYEATVMASGDVVQAIVRSSDGVTVASGFAAETGDCFVYDRIYTDAAHRQRGLARAVMKILSAARKSPGTRQVLVATEQGRGLYLTMGWAVLSPWTTAFIPEA
jgi:GNAT superfamily N-acetyltransferase